MTPPPRLAATSSRGSGATWGARRWTIIRRRRRSGSDYECGVRNAECGASGGGSVKEAYICAALRTPVGKHGGALAGGPAGGLAAVPIRAVGGRSGVDPSGIHGVLLRLSKHGG